MKSGMIVGYGLMGASILALTAGLAQVAFPETTTGCRNLNVPPTNVSRSLTDKFQICNGSGIVDRFEGIRFQFGVMPQSRDAYDDAGEIDLASRTIRYWGGPGVTYVHRNPVSFERSLGQLCTAWQSVASDPGHAVYRETGAKLCGAQIGQFEIRHPNPTAHCPHSSHYCSQAPGSKPG